MDLLAILIPVILKLIDKLIPDQITRKREFKTGRRAKDWLKMTHEQIARRGRK